METTVSPALALLFPGQGSQRPGMGEPWRECPSWELLARIAEWSGYDIEHALLRADAEQLRRTDVAQLAVFALSMLAHREFLSCYPAARVHGHAGHSLGEYSALVAAGALSLKEATGLVVARGRAMLAAAGRSTGTMAVLVGGPNEQVEAAVDAARFRGELLWVANVNAPGQVVVSGTQEAVDRFAADAPRLGAKAIRIPVGGAFHSPLMASARTELSDRMARTSFAREHRPVVANIDARVHTRGHDWGPLGLSHLTERVRWDESVATLLDQAGCDALLELGPGKTLTGFNARIAPGVPAWSASTPEQVRALARAWQESGFRAA